MIVVLCITLGFILFDIVSGIIKALYKEGLNSTILREGLFHKLSEIIALCGAWLLEYATTYMDLGFDVPLLNGVAIYIDIMELISIIENLCEVNPALNKLFKPYLEKLKKPGGDDKDE